VNGTSYESLSADFEDSTPAVSPVNSDSGYTRFCLSPRRSVVSATLSGPWSPSIPHISTSMSEDRPTSDRTPVDLSAWSYGDPPSPAPNPLHRSPSGWTFGSGVLTPSPPTPIASQPSHASAFVTGSPSTPVGTSTGLYDDDYSKDVRYDGLVNYVCPTDEQLASKTSMALTKRCSKWASSILDDMTSRLTSYNWKSRFTW
jgi:hypothetical protein